MLDIQFIYLLFPLLVLLEHGPLDGTTHVLLDRNFIVFITFALFFQYFYLSIQLVLVQ